MINLHQLMESYQDYPNASSEDETKYEDKYEAMKRVLCSTARKYNQTYLELEQLKEATGLNKTFPILSLPREIRDEIYTYSLCAASVIETKMRGLPCVTVDDPFKPPAPGLLRANKQIYYEAIDILYSKNVFGFEKPEHLFAFEEQIGPANRKQVRELCFKTQFPDQHERHEDPRDLLPRDYHNIPVHWIGAFRACSFEKTEHLVIELTYRNPEVLYSFFLKLGLELFIDELLGRVVDGKVPRLSVRGFRDTEEEKFPKTRDAVEFMGFLEEEVRRMYREWQESHLEVSGDEDDVYYEQ